MVLLTNAVRDGRTHQVKLLLKAGVNVNLSDKNGQTALIHCCFQEDSKARMSILKLLVANGSDASKKDKFGRNVVSWACVYARADLLTYLLNDSNIELDFSVIDKDGNTTLMLAVMSGCLEMVQIVMMAVLKTSGVSQVHRYNNAGMCPLLVAFSRGDKKCARLLIKEGSSPVSSIIKYLQEQDELDTVKSHPFYNFIAKSHDLENSSDNPKVFSEKDILQFLFAKDDAPTSKQANKTRTSLSLKTKANTLLDFSSTKSTIGLNTRKSYEQPDIAEIDMTSESLDATNVRFTVRKYYSTQESVQQLYDLYQEQLTTSYREGLPVRRYRTPTPPAPPPRKESRAHRNSVQLADMKGYLSSKRGSNASSTCSNPLMQESALDRQIRMRYARSNRAASMQVGKLPPIPLHLRKMKRTKSSTSLKVQI